MQIDSTCLVMAPLHYRPAS